MKFLDQAKINLASGKGGRGCVSFRKEKYIEFGGPNGGNGCKGGNVVIVGDPNLNTLIDFRYQQHFKAKKGDNGKGQNQTGVNGKDVIIKVPFGTQIYNEDKSVLLVDLIKKNDQIIIALGGQGGLGNSHFKSSTNRAPRQFTEGGNSEEKSICLSLKLFADVGIIGMPNAGKSTFLSTVSAAHPKIADYPFTTLHPVLGIVKKFDQEIIIADIPGLVEGAHEGKGLGDRFLAHIERCKILLHMIDCSQNNFIDNYNKIRNEIIKYGRKLEKKSEIIAISKSDLSKEDHNELQNIVKIKTGKTPFVFSCRSKIGIDVLISDLLNQSNK